jgi:hypothetical protein
VWWSETFYHLAEGKPSELKALDELDIVAFYQLLANHIKHYKPAS